MIAISYQPLRTAGLFLPSLRGGDALRTAASTLLIFIAMLAWTSALYFPFRSVEFSDDAFFLEVAHLWTRGALPYVGAFDIKPPGFFAILAIAESLMGPTLQTIHAASVFFDALSATALFFLGSRMGSRTIGMSSALLYPFLSLFVTNNSAYPSLAAFTILAFLAALSSLPIQRRAFLAGLSIGVAIAIKQTAAFEGIALLLVLLRGPEPAPSRTKTTILFGLGVVVAPLAAVSYFAAHDAAGLMLSDVVVSALKRPDSPVESISFFVGVLRSVLFLPAQIELIFVLACLGLIRRRAIVAAAPNAEVDALGLWCVAAFLSIWAQHAIFKSYLGAALAPLILLAHTLLAFAAPELKRVPIAFRCAALGLITVVSVVFVGKPGRGVIQEWRDIDGVAQAIKATRPAANDKLFVAGRGLGLYVATDLAPPTPYFYWEHALCDFPDAGPTRLADTLALTPRYLVVENHQNMCGTPAAWAKIGETLAHSYRLAAHIVGNEDIFDVYEAVDTTPRTGPLKSDQYRY
jgi:hypothetical protein